MTHSSDVHGRATRYSAAVESRRVTRVDRQAATVESGLDGDWQSRGVRNNGHSTRGFSESRKAFRGRAVLRECQRDGRYRSLFRAGHARGPCPDDRGRARHSAGIPTHLGDFRPVIGARRHGNGRARRVRPCDPVGAVNRRSSCYPSHECCWARCILDSPGQP